MSLLHSDMIAGLALAVSLGAVLFMLVQHRLSRTAIVECTYWVWEAIEGTTIAPDHRVILLFINRSPRPSAIIGGQLLTNLGKGEPTGVSFIDTNNDYGIGLPLALQPWTTLRIDCDIPCDSGRPSQLQWFDMDNNRIKASQMMGISGEDPRIRKHKEDEERKLKGTEWARDRLDKRRKNEKQ